MSDDTQRDYTKERNDEVVPVVRELLKILASREDLPIAVSAESEQNAAKYFQELYVSEIVPLLIKSNLKLDAIKYLFSLTMQPIQLLNDVTTSSFEMNRDIADAKKYGLKDIADMRVNDLDAALKEEKTVDNKEVSA